MEENKDLNNLENDKLSEEEIIRRLEEAARMGAKQGVKENRTTAFIENQLLNTVLKMFLLAALVFSASSAASGLNPINAFKNLFAQEGDVEGHDLTLQNNGIFGYTAADFADVILGDSSKLKKLEVYSQEMSQLVQFTDTGLGNLKIFTKSKYYTYYATAIYTVDLSMLSSDSIELDKEKLTVVLTIPNAEMTTLDIPQDKMEIGDTQKGLLSFGELNMTDEQSKELMARAREDMTNKLNEGGFQERANKIAKMTVWELYQPLITKMAPGYSLNIEFAE